MPAFVYDKCCLCIDLRTGCFIIGYLHLLGEIIIALGGLLFFALGGVVVAEGDNTAYDKSIGLALIIMGALLLVFIALLLGFTITLLVGLHKNKRGYVKAFLIYYAVFIVIYTVVFIASLFSSSNQVSTIISSIFEILLMIYFFLVIRSQYHKMDDVNKGVIYRTA